MENSDKSGEQLMDELTKLRQRIAELEELLGFEKGYVSAVLRSIDDGVVATNADGKVVSMNEVAESITGWTAKEAIGKPLSEVFRIMKRETRESLEDATDGVLRSGKTGDFVDHVVLLSKDGTERLITESILPIRNKEDSVVGSIVVFHDITEKQRMEEELLKAQKLESIGVLSAGIANDFNNLLTGILGNISLVRTYTDLAKISERLEEAENASTRAKDLTNQLLAFSRSGVPVKRATSIAKILKNSTTSALKDSNVRCEFSIPATLWQAEVDEEQISQVITNLVVNADQAMPQGGIIRVRAENVVLGAGNPFPLKNGRYLKISIQDQGIGISKAHLQRMFDPYFTTKQKGSGLGLATSYSIVKNHNGHITAESQMGLGTTFYTYLPASSKKAIVEEEKEKQEQPTVDKKKVLVMDDEEFIRRLACDVLGGLGYEVSVAKEGREAVRLYKEAKESERPFDAVIVDLAISEGMEGKEAIQELIELDPEVKAIVSSGYARNPIMDDYRKFGFKGVIAKPYEISELEEVLRSVIEG